MDILLPMFTVKLAVASIGANTIAMKRQSTLATIPISRLFFVLFSIVLTWRFVFVNKLTERLLGATMSAVVAPRVDHRGLSHAKIVSAHYISR